MRSVPTLAAQISRCPLASRIGTLRGGGSRGKLNRMSWMEMWPRPESVQDRGHLCADLLVNGQVSFPVVYLENQGGRRVDFWRTINEQRVMRNDWAFMGPEAERNSLHPTTASFRMIAERNQARARRRYSRARRLTSLGDDGEPWGEDSYLDEHSADDSLPPEPSDFPLTLSGNYRCPLRVRIRV